MPLARIPQAGIFPPRSRNLVINGNFDIWQRGTSNSAAAGSVRYLADRWSTNSVGSTTANSQQSFGIQAAVPLNPRFFHRSVVVSSAGASNFANLTQNIEDVTVTQGQTIALGFWAKADTTRNIAVEFTQNFGSGGGTEVTSISPTIFSLTSSWQKFALTTTLPGIVTTVSSSIETSSLRLIFWFDAGSSFNARTNTLGQQSGTFDIASVQIEVGSVSSPMELLPAAETWDLCTRYYAKLGGVSGAMRAYFYSGGVDTFGIPVYYPSRTRIIPVVTKVGTWTATNCAQPSVTGITETGCTLQAAQSGTGVSSFYCVDANTYLTVDAEF